MYFDHLDEIYAMVKSNLQYDKLVLTGLTGFHDRSDRSAQIVQQTWCVPILGVNKYLLNSFRPLPAEYKLMVQILKRHSPRLSCILLTAVRSWLPIMVSLEWLSSALKNSIHIPLQNYQFHSLLSGYTTLIISYHNLNSCTPNIWYCLYFVDQICLYFWKENRILYVLPAERY